MEWVVQIGLIILAALSASGTASDYMHSRQSGVIGGVFLTVVFVLGSIAFLIGVLIG